MSLSDELDDLVDEWHEGRWPDKSLEDVIRLRTSWTHEQFERWVTGGLSAVNKPQKPPPLLERDGSPLYGNP